MSRSNPSTAPAVNPCTRWFQWDSKTKQFEYYDKGATNIKDPTKKGENIGVKLPFRFLVLDYFNTVAGFYRKPDGTKSLILSNEIKDLKNDLLTVKIKGCEPIVGTWAQIKDDKRVKGIKAALSIYIGFFDENKELKLGNLKLHGGSFGAWIEIQKEYRKNKKNITEGAFVVKEFVQKEYDGTPYNTPVFVGTDIKEETNAKAIELDKVFQEYLKSYFKQKASSEPDENDNTNTTSEKIQDDAPEVVTGTFDDEDF